jgi:hypothetical protein
MGKDSSNKLSTIHMANHNNLVEIGPSTSFTKLKEKKCTLIIVDGDSSGHLQCTLKHHEKKRRALYPSCSTYQNIVVIIKV